MIILKAKNISKSFGKTKVIDNFSFELKSGEILVMEGRSGTGKTTLLRIINNLEKADSGTLILNGNALFTDGIYSRKEEILRYQRSIGMVFQNFALFPHLNVYENLCLAPRHLNLANEKDLEQRATNILERLEIVDKIHVMPQTLSGGEKQRVAVARAIMLKPKLLCFDEPTSALDKDSTENVIHIMKDLSKMDIGIFIISHDTEFSRTVADTLLHSKAFKSMEGCV